MLKVKRLILTLITVISILLLSIIAFNQVKVSEAAEARQTLDIALASIRVPQSGEIIHYSVAIYDRTPPNGLEPSDPYHLPYANIWPSVEYEDTWVSIDANGNTVFWRTQLRSATNELLQDLMFNGVEEVDYFPLENRAIRIPQQLSPYRDNRVALIEDFLAEANLKRSQNHSIDGRPVLSVYTEPKQIVSQLLSFA